MTSLTVIGLRCAYTSVPMEWVLQVVDEIDDAVAVVRHGWLGAQAHLAMLAGGLAAATAAVFTASRKARLSPLRSS